MSIFAGIGSALLGGALGLVGNKQQADAMEEANEGAGMPMWDPRQTPYLFGDTGYQFNMPQATDAGMAHGLALMGGYNPAQGGAMQAPMDISYLMQSLLGPQMDPSGSAGAQQMQSMLGYGAPTPPAFMTSSPYYQGQQPQQAVQTPYELLGQQQLMQAPQQPRWQENSPFADSGYGSGYDWIGH